MQFDFFFVPALPLAAHTAGACAPDFTPRLAPHLRTRTRLSYETENITRDARLTRLHLIKILNPIPLSVNQNLFPLKIPASAHFPKGLTFPPFCI